MRNHLFTYRQPVTVLLVSIIALTAAAAAGEPVAISQLPQTATLLSEGKTPVRIVCFGDSITGVYYHTGSRRAYTRMFQLALERLYPTAKISAVNAGISGHTTRNALARIDKDVLSHKPHLVTVMFGMNDVVRVPLAEFKENLIEIVTRCRQVGAEVLLCTPNSVYETTGRPSDKLVRYVETVRSVGREQKLPVADFYRLYESVQSESPREWSLLMSDAIHPNMNGHKLFAEEMARFVSGKAVSLRDEGPLQPAIPKTLALLKSNQRVKVLAMPPFDELIEPALRKIAPQAIVEVTTWPTANLSLAEIEQAAKAVRAKGIDLVLLAVPRSAAAKTEEEFIRSYSWVMNWSLHFSQPEWDCLVVHPVVVEGPAGSLESARDLLVRRLVAAQDLSLIDRSTDAESTPAELLAGWFRDQAKLAGEQGQ